MKKEKTNPEIKTYLKAILSIFGKGIVFLLLSSQTYANGKLYEVIGERLSQMKEVAAYKFRKGIPIQSIEREERVISLAIQAGLSQRITKESLRKIFQTQIEAAREIQFCWIERFAKMAIPPESPDLTQVIRPKLEALGKNIVKQIPHHVTNNESFFSHLDIECLSDKSKYRILAALQEVKFYNNSLEQISESGILRVGTTGDYAPFSFESLSSGKLEGIDIDLAKSLAEKLKVNIVFVKTSWPDLMDDLARLKYDIAMSGVSITKARSKKAYFSNPYHVGGKVPISLCSKADRFSSLEQIDREGITLIVNPGGTNEKYLDENIRYATKMLHDDNKTIFSRIIDGKADLMITDKIEVSLQTKKNPKLCGTLEEPLNYQEKGFMISKDDAFRTVLNDWLKELVVSGELQEKFTVHLGRN